MGRIFTSTYQNPTSTDARQKGRNSGIGDFFSPNDSITPKFLENFYQFIVGLPTTLWNILFQNLSVITSIQTPRPYLPLLGLHQFAHKTKAP